MFLEIFQNLPLVESLAETLLHSVWQIGLLSFCLFLALRFVSKSNANLRYGLAVSALVLSLILPAVTFFYISNFPFYSNDQQIISTKTSKAFVQEELENSEVVYANNKAITEAKTAKETNAFGTLQNSFGYYFSRYSSFLVAFWFVGILFFSVRLFGGFWQLRRFKTKEVFDVSTSWQIRFVEICEKLNIKQNVRLLKSNLIESPMVIGWIKPVILVPASVFLQMNPSQLETIIAHELMHIRRFDYLVNFAQSFVEILFFYHPCVWWISSKIRQERECACDDAVLNTLENAQFTYANALANLEAFRLNAKQNESQLNVAANGGKLMNRIERIVKKETKRSGLQNSLWSASLASMLILAFVVTVFWTNAQADVNENKAVSPNVNRKMAVGIVAIPSNYKKGIDRSPDETIRLLISKLQTNGVSAVGFVTGSKILKDGQVSKTNADIVRSWRDAGLEVGVGGYKHLRFYDTDYKNYVENTENNIEIVKPILAETGQELRYFSYPFLNTGSDIETKIRFERWLKKNDLQFIPYTFDNQEWMFSFAFDEARKQNDVAQMAQVKRGFLEYMEKMVIHYEGYSEDLFGREIPQTLVLTSSRLVADSADELFAMFKIRGYEFVSMKEALADRAYSQPETFTGRAGISWMERWTMTRKGELRQEPEVNKFIKDKWQSRNMKIPPKPLLPPTPPIPPIEPKSPPPLPPNAIADAPKLPPTPSVSPRL